MNYKSLKKTEEKKHLKNSPELQKRLKMICFSYCSLNYLQERSNNLFLILKIEFNNIFHIATKPISINNLKSNNRSINQKLQ